MTDAEPDSLADSLFNEIGSLPLFDTDRAKELHLALVRLRRQAPSVFSVRVALAIAALKLGRRSEAISSLDEANGLKTRSELTAWGALADLNVIVGRLDVGGTLLRQLLATPGAIAVPQIQTNAVSSLMVLGDMDGLVNLDRAIKDMGGENHQPTELMAADVLSVLRDAHLGPTFAAHQRIVSAVLKDVRTWVNPHVRTQDRAQPTLVIEHLVIGDRVARSQLQREILDALRAHYQSVGLELGRVLPFLLNKVSPAPDGGFAPFAIAS